MVPTAATITTFHNQLITNYSNINRDKTEFNIQYCYVILAQ